MGRGLLQLAKRRQASRALGRVDFLIRAWDIMQLLLSRSQGMRAIGHISKHLFQVRTPRATL